MTDELLSCPICGENKFGISMSLHRVHLYCLKCGFSAPNCMDIPGATEQWNNCVVLERQKDAISSHKAKWLNKDTVIPILSFLIVLLLIGLPTYFVAKNSQLYNPLSQVLFDLLLFAASLWFALTTSNKEAKKSATDKWLPAAEAACNGLLTMSDTTRRMRSRQGKTCDSINSIFPDIPPDNLKRIKAHMKIHCQTCTDNLSDLNEHLEDAIKNWKAFINTNCEAMECQYINERLAKRKDIMLKEHTG